MRNSVDPDNICREQCAAASAKDPATLRVAARLRLRAACIETALFLFFISADVAKPASSRWSSLADVLSPAQRSLCSAAAAPRSMGQRSVENGQHGHTVDSTVPCRARRPGLIADQLHIHSLCRRRCWRELALHVFDQCSLDSGLP